MTEKPICKLDELEEYLNIESTDRPLSLFREVFSNTNSVLF